MTKTEIENLYNKMKSMTFEELKVYFPSSKSIIKQKKFSYETLLSFKKEKSKSKNESKVLTSLSLIFGDAFSPKNIEDISDEKKQENAQILQKVFFFFIKDLVEESEDEEIQKLVSNVEKTESCFELKTQNEILNKLCSFIKDNPFSESVIDFEKYKSNHFEANESILRLFYNFSRPKESLKESIINELNFVREQQRAILPCIVNTRKSNYSISQANAEIKEKSDNEKKLKNLDCGFLIENFCQSISSEHPLTRSLVCKAFRETDSIWLPKPYFDRRKNRIIARKNEREQNKNSLYKKYLYQERNVFTHSGENVSIFGLFSKEYKSIEKRYWQELILESLFDVHSFYKKNKSEISKNFLFMSDEFLKKITKNLNLPQKNLWSEIFDKKGNLTINQDLLKQTDIYDVLDDDDFELFKDFMTFSYCSLCETDDFILKHQFRIKLYILYLTLNLASLD